MRPHPRQEMIAGARELAAAFPALRGIRLAVVGHSLYDPRARRIVAGGTETYVLALGRIARALGGDVVFLQRASGDFDVEVAPGVAARSWSSPEQVGPMLVRCRKEAAGRNAIHVFFYPDHLPGPDDQPSVFVHHGIVEDGSADKREMGALGRRLVDARRTSLFLRRRRKLLRLVEATTATIAVDTNVGNVVRVLHPQLDWGDRIQYVPNFGQVLPRAEVCAKWRDGRPPTVLYARRFVFYRGTWLWAEALRELAPRFPAARFRCLGHGPGEAALREVAARHPNVQILEKAHEEMAAEYRDAHVSVVPSLWSEGTSLAAIEAMGAGNAVVATPIGGLGNVVVPDLNGLLVPATAPRVAEAVGSLLSDWPRARRLGLSAHRVAAASFSEDVWARRVCRVLASALADPVPRPLRRWPPANRPS